jgi:tetratricopeptide (TPR) repeat protein
MTGDSKTKLLRDAEKYVLQGKMQQAIAEYLKIIKNDPNDVLTLNTIGDLYLRQGKVSEANKYFSQVAENYARNNFLLKAIAVYKKILNAEPGNLEINLTVASLFMKQGLNVDARNQYLRVAELCAKEGKTREARDAYEKVAEMDPLNFSVQLKLAEIHLAEGAKDKAHAYFAGAARAQAKAGDNKGALNSFKRALQLDPVDVELMKNFLDTCIHLADVTPVLEQLKKSLGMAPDNVALHEMLGHACLAARDPAGAEKAFQFVLSQDESRYQSFLFVSREFLEAGDYDRSAACLDQVIPIFISRRETEKAIGAYTLILSSNPTHVLTLTKLEGIYSATNDRTHYLDVLEKISSYYLSKQSPREALEYLEKILAANPGSAKHLKLHREAFEQAFPGMPYSSPVAAQDASREGALVGTAAPGRRDLSGAPGESSNPVAVEVDLLLNYGMRERALEMLQSAVTQDPTDKDIRARLLSLYKEDRDYGKAAEQCLLLAAIYRRSNNEETALKFLAEGRKLSPDLVGPQFDLAGFARARGLPTEFAGPEPAMTETRANVELDLSGDLSEIFFKESAEPETAMEVEAPADVELPAGEFMQEIPLKPPSESVREQLQEVDFYIRLGFFEEARVKLDQIARNYPNNPELPMRYRQLSGGEGAPAPSPSVSAPGRHDSSAPAETPQSDSADVFREARTDQALGVSVENHSVESPPAVQAQPDDFNKVEGPLEAPSPPEMQGVLHSLPEGQRVVAEGPVNAMFADLIEEVNALTDQEIAREEFENHFSLGIAYREMELTEEAIKEFQSAFKVLSPAKFPKEVIQCCGMLSTCFLEKGMPRSAIRWCQAGLGISGITAHEDLAFRYDMGVARSILGDSSQALECFDHIYGIDPSYRDVAQKIDSLRGGPSRHGS